MSLQKKTALSIAVISAINFAAQAQVTCGTVYQSQPETAINALLKATPSKKKSTADIKDEAQDKAQDKAKAQDKKQTEAEVKVAATLEAEARGAKPVEAPRDKVEITRLAEKMWSGNVREKAMHLKAIHNWMYYSFPGREAAVDKIMAVIKTSVLFPDIVKKPQVIDMFGLPGDGKTAMVSTLGNYLGLKSRFVQVNVKDGEVAVGLEVFRSLADVPNDGKQPGIGFLVIDEFQKFKPAAELDAKKEIVSFDAYGSEVKKIVNEVEQRQGFVRTVYDIYGNGSEKAAPSKKLETYATELDGYLKAVETNRGESTKTITKIMEAKDSIEKAKDDAEKEKIKTNIETLEQSLSVYRTRATDAEKQVRAYLRFMMRDYGDLMGPFRGQEIDALANQAIDMKSAFIDFLKDTAMGATEYQRTYTYKQMITFLLGNPEQSIKEIKDNARGQTLDADQFFQLVGQIDNSKIAKELFEDVFGTETAGLRQRLNVDQWAIMPPLTKAQWVTFVERQVEVMKNQFEDVMAKSEMKEVKLLTHPSVTELLKSEAVISTEGARTYFERATKLTGNFIADLATRIIEVDPSSRPEQVQWSYESATREFVVAGWRGGKIVLEERVAVSKLGTDQSTIKMDEYDIKRAVLQKAGQLIMGISTYGELPSTFRFDPEMIDASVNGLWSSPSKTRFTTVADFVNMALGSNVSQNMARDGFTALNDPSLKFAHEMVRRMVDDLRRREQEYSFLVERAADGTKTYDKTFPQPIGLSKEVLEAMKEATEARQGEPAGAAAREQAAYGKVLRLMIQDVNLTLQQNAELMRSLSTLIKARYDQYQAGQIASPEITSVDLQKLIAENRKFAKRKPITQVIAKWMGLKVKASPVSMVLTPDRVGQNPGQIAVVDPLDFGKAPKIKGWDRFMNIFFNKPLPQRSLNPR